MWKIETQTLLTRRPECSASFVNNGPWDLNKEQNGWALSRLTWLPQSSQLCVHNLERFDYGTNFTPKVFIKGNYRRPDSFSLRNFQKWSRFGYAILGREFPFCLARTSFADFANSLRFSPKFTRSDSIIQRRSSTSFYQDILKKLFAIGNVVFKTIFKACSACQAGIPRAVLLTRPWSLTGKTPAPRRCFAWHWQPAFYGYTNSQSWWVLTWIHKVWINETANVCKIAFFPFVLNMAKVPDPLCCRCSFISSQFNRCHAGLETQNTPLMATPSSLQFS